MRDGEATVVPLLRNADRPESPSLPRPPRPPRAGQGADGMGSAFVFCHGELVEVMGRFCRCGVSLEWMPRG